MKLKILLEVTVETNTEDVITTDILTDVQQHFTAALIDDISNTEYCNVGKMNVRSIIILKDKILETV